MATIGTFKQTDKGYEGTIATLMSNRKVRFITNKNKKNEDSPDYFVKSGRCDLGVAWKATKTRGVEGKARQGNNNGDKPLDYIRVLLDAPEMDKPINAALFTHDKGADLVWSRQKH